MKITDKYVPNLLLSILLVFALIGSAATAMTKFYILNEDTFIKNSDENNIPELAYEEIEEYFKNSENYSRIPADVYMSMISEEDVKNIIDAKTQNAFTMIKSENNEQVYFDFTKLENNISDYFNKFALENNVQIDEAYTAQLKKTIDTAKSEIENFADIYMLEFMGDKILLKVQKIYKYIDPVMYGCIGFTAVCIILIAVISRKCLRFAIYWYSMAFICSSVLMLIPTLYIKLSGMTNNLIIRNKCIYTAITSYISKTLTSLMTAEIIILAVGIVFIVLYAVIPKKEK